MAKWLDSLPNNDGTRDRHSTRELQRRRLRAARKELCGAHGAIRRWQNAVAKNRPGGGRGAWTEAWVMLSRLENRLIGLVSDHGERGRLRRSVAKAARRLLGGPEPPPVPEHHLRLQAVLSAHNRPSRRFDLLTPTPTLSGVSRAVTAVKAISASSVLVATTKVRGLMVLQSHPLSPRRETVP